MKNKLLLLELILIATAALACKATDERQTASKEKTQSSSASRQAGAPQGAQPVGATSAHDSARGGAPAHTHSHAAVKAEGVPAFETSPASLKNLPPTLSPDLFTGKQREAYRMVKEIPQTIAQLPCYCHCDKGFGHKSLHTCFVDDHAAHCAICVDEAVLAYDLQKKAKLKPEQIRERIIAQYSTKQ